MSYPSEHEDDQMTEEELAAQFGEPVPVHTPPENPDEVIYAVKARIKNLASLAVNTNLTPVGEQLANCYTHVLMDFYKYANTLEEPHKGALKVLIRHHEKMVAEFISSVPSPNTKRSMVPTLDPRGQEKQYEEPYVPDDQKALVDAYMRHIRDQEARNRPEMSKVIYPPEPPKVPFWDTDVPKPSLWQRIRTRLFG